MPLAHISAWQPVTSSQGVHRACRPHSVHLNALSCAARAQRFSCVAIDELLPLHRRQEFYTSINTKNAGSYYTDVFSMVSQDPRFIPVACETRCMLQT